MADILIKNMGLPKEGFIRLMIYPDGTVREINSYNEAVMPTEAKAVVLPEHGDLIDRDELKIDDSWALVSTGTIWDAPVIVEAT